MSPAASLYIADALQAFAVTVGQEFRYVCISLGWSLLFGLVGYILGILTMIWKGKQ